MQRTSKTQPEREPATGKPGRAGEVAGGGEADYAHSPAGLLTLDRHGLILRVNLTAARLLGREAAVLTGQPLEGFFMEADKAAYRRHRREAGKAGKTRACELRLERRDGQEWWVGLMTAAGKEGGRRVDYVAMSDITERKRREAELGRTEERYRRIVQTAEEGIWTINEESLTDYVNPKMAEMMGYKVEEMLGRPLNDFMDEEGRAMLADILKRRRRGAVEQFEFKYVRKDGSKLWAFVSTNPITNSKGEYAGAMALLTDISARRAAEIAMRESEERYRLLADHCDDIVGLNDTKGNSLYISPSYYRKTGWTPEEVSSVSWRKRLHPDDLEMIEKARNENLAGKTTRITHRARCKDDSWLWFETSCRPIRGADGEVWRLLVWSHDVTETKKAEAALQESEAQFRAIFEQAAVGVALIDTRAGRFVRVNQRACEILGGGSKERMLGQRFKDRTHPEDARMERELMRQMKEGERRAFTMEKRWLREDGETTWIHQTVSPMWSEGAAPTRHIAVMQDITERKAVELELARTTELLLRTGEMAKIGGWELDLRTQSLFWSVETCRLFEIEGTVAPPLEEAIGYYAPEARPKIRAAVEEAIRLGKAYDLELRVITAKGRMLWTRSQGSAVREGGKVVKLTGTFQDVTERKESEERYLRELKFSETLVDHTSAIIVLLDRQGRMVHVNEATVTILGYSRQELVGRTPWEMGIMSEEERVRALERLKALLSRGGSNPPRETVLRAKNGQEHVFALSSIATMTPEGEPDRIIVTGTDLTERNRLQGELLKIAEREQARIGHNLHDGIGQTMTGVATLMEGLEAELKGKVKESAARIRELVQEAIQEVRRMSHSLSPPAVKNRGLGGVLRLLADMIRMDHRTECELTLDPGVEVGDPEVETHIYRIAQEAANNALRHGKPKKVAISLSRLGSGEGVLKVEDDGSGMKPGKGSEGIGLQVMEYRANLIGGVLNVTARPRRGVRVTCRFPLAGRKEGKPAGTGGRASQ